MENNEIPLRFRVWDKSRKAFVLENASIDEYARACESGAVSSTTDEVSQYAGFLDDDGKEIASGDILKVHFNRYWSESKTKKEDFTGVVVIGSKGVRIVYGDGWGDYLEIGRHPFDTGLKLKILGNKWENPELL